LQFSLTISLAPSFHRTRARPSVLGASEVLGAIAIALSPWVLPKSLGSLASLGLIAIMGGAIYLHHAFNDAVTFPAMLAALCVLRLIVTPASRAAKKMKSQ
jgi:hypothetical protein